VLLVVIGASFALVNLDDPSNSSGPNSAGPVASSDQQQDQQQDPQQDPQPEPRPEPQPEPQPQPNVTPSKPLQKLVRIEKGMLFQFDVAVDLAKIQLIKPAEQGDRAQEKGSAFKKINLQPPKDKKRALVNGNDRIASLESGSNNKELRLNWFVNLEDEKNVTSRHVIACTLFNFGNGTYGGTGLSGLFREPPPTVFKHGPDSFPQVIRMSTPALPKGHPLVTFAFSDYCMAPLQTLKPDNAVTVQQGTSFVMPGKDTGGSNYSKHVPFTVTENRNGTLTYPIWKPEPLKFAESKPAPANTPPATPVSKKLKLAILRGIDSTDPDTLAGDLEFEKRSFSGTPDPKTYAVLNYPESKVRVENNEIKAGDRVLATINSDASGNLVVNINVLPEELRKVARDLLIQVSEKDCLLIGRKLFNTHKRFHVVRVGNTKNLRIKDYDDLSDATKLIYTEFFKKHIDNLETVAKGKTKILTLHRTSNPHERYLHTNNKTPVIFDPAQLQITINDRLAECEALRFSLESFKPPPAPNPRDEKYEKGGNGQLTPKGRQAFTRDLVAWNKLVDDQRKAAEQSYLQKFIAANLSSLNPNWEKIPPTIPGYAIWLKVYKESIKDDYQVLVQSQVEFSIKVDNQLTIIYQRSF